MNNATSLSRQQQQQQQAPKEKLLLGRGVPRGTLGLREEDRQGRKVTIDGRNSSFSSLVSVWFHANVAVGGMRYLHRGFEFEANIHQRWIPPKNGPENQCNPTEDIA